MRKSIIFLLLLTALIAPNVVYVYLKGELAKQEPDIPPPSGSEKTPILVPPPMESLGHGARMPTPEELEDEAGYSDMQVAKANERITSPQAEKRLEGLEALSAYPTLKAQQIITNTLTMDFDPKVRRAAAQTLSVIKQPTDDTVAALLSALEDTNEEVQVAAFNTLMGMAERMKRGSTRLKTVFAHMKNISSARRASPLTKHLISSFLKDQETYPIP